MGNVHQGFITLLYAICIFLLLLTQSIHLEQRLQVATKDVGIAKDGSVKDTFTRGVELVGRQVPWLFSFANFVVLLGYQFI